MYLHAFSSSPSSFSNFKKGSDEVILDLNEISQHLGQDLDLGTAVVSRDQSMVCYTLDRSEDGSEYYSLHIKCLRSGQTLVLVYKRTFEVCFLIHPDMYLINVTFNTGRRHDPE
jgi:protease II